MSETNPRARPNITGNAFFKQIIKRGLVPAGCEVVFKNTKYHVKATLQEKQDKFFILYKEKECESCADFTIAIFNKSGTNYNKKITFGNMTYEALQDKLNELTTQNVAVQGDQRFNQALHIFGEFLKNFKKTQDEHLKQQQKMMDDVMKQLNALKIETSEQETEQNDEDDE